MVVVKHALRVDVALCWLDEVARVKRPQYLPVVRRSCCIYSHVHDRTPAAVRGRADRMVGA